MSLLRHWAWSAKPLFKRVFRLAVIKAAIRARRRRIAIFIGTDKMAGKIIRHVMDTLGDFFVETTLGIRDEKRIGGRGKGGNRSSGAVRVILENLKRQRAYFYRLTIYRLLLCRHCII